jgi:hypothetical protein
MEIKGWLSLFCGLTAVVSMIFAGIGFGNVSDMEQAESDNMLRMSFNVSDIAHYDQSRRRVSVRVEMDTGVLSQSHVRYRVYETKNPRNDGTDGSPEVLCYSGSVDGAEDVAGWYELGSYVSLAVAATDPTRMENTQRNTLLPATKTQNISLPAGMKSALQSTLNERLNFFNTMNATQYLTFQYAEVFAGAGVPLPVSLYIGSTSTAVVTTDEGSGDEPTMDASTTTMSGSTTTPAVVAFKGCQHALKVQQDKFFYSMLAWHNKERTPRPDSDALVFSRASLAAAHSLSVVSKEIETDCFISQYRDDVQALLMSFEAVEVWSVAHLVTTIFVLFGVFALTRADTLAPADKVVFAIVSVLLCGYLAAIAWMLKSQIGAVVDGVKDAIPTKACPNNHIQAIYSNDGATHAETMYTVAFSLNIVTGVLAALAIVMTDSSNKGTSFGWNKL